MASQAPEHNSSENETGIEELDNLKSEVDDLAQKVLHYRATLPDRVKDTFSAVLASQRPIVPRLESGSDPGPSGDPKPDSGVHVESGKGEEYQETVQKARLLKEKMASLTSSMPIALKRMNESISWIGKLDSYKGAVCPPAFKRKRTS